jgi:glutamate carboxypeptidase
MTASRPPDPLQYFRKRQPEIVDTIKQLVEIESPSDVKQAVDRLGTVIASRFGELGGRVQLHQSEKVGNHLQIDFPGPRARKPVLLLGHTDTVYPIGTISRMPCRASSGRLTGPGVLDMKAGIALAFHVIEAMLLWGGGKLPRPVSALFVSDEEVGSGSSRAITEKLARRSEATLVLEPAFGLDGAVKTARKGIGEYQLKVSGKPAHSGLDFEKGQSAVVELARQVLEIEKLVDLKRGITLNVGKVSGGGRVNVVPAEASASIDLRVATLADAKEADRRLRALKSFNSQCSLRMDGGLNRPPMERSAGIASLYAIAKKIALELGFDLPEAAVGGGSDGNFTAALGVPTLDGLGAVGEGAHAPLEYVIISELPKRAALLAGLIQRI